MGLRGRHMHVPKACEIETKSRRHPSWLIRTMPSTTPSMGSAVHSCPHPMPLPWWGNIPRMQREQGTTICCRTLQHRCRSVRALGQWAIKPQWLRHGICLLLMPLWQMQQILSAGFVQTHWWAHGLDYCHKTSSFVSPIPTPPPLPPPAPSPNPVLLLLPLYQPRATSTHCTGRRAIQQKQTL